MDKESKSRKKDFCGEGGGRGYGGYAGKVVDIKRMTKNLNPGFFIFPFLFLAGLGEGAGTVGPGQVEVLEGD